MEITEVRVKLVEGKQDKLKAFCSITIDDSFVIRDLKIIEGVKGLFVAMPSRKITVRCNSCSYKNQIGSRFCNSCGAGQGDRDVKNRDGRLKLHADIAHPINQDCRESIQNRVLDNYRDELAASVSPDYRPQRFEDFEDELDGEEAESLGHGLGQMPTRNLGFPREERVAEPRDRGFETVNRSPERGSRSPERGSRSPERGNRSPERVDRQPEREGGPPEREGRGSEREDRRIPHEKTVETRNPPPDDNFGAGIF